MNKAKAAVEGFIHKAGHHDTTVHETVAPAVTNETVRRTQVNERQTAIDKEVHQEHHHTSIQPVHDREVLPEEHHHRMGDVEHRDINHGDSEAVRAKLERERAQFRNVRNEADTQVTEKAAPVVAGEHVHHHVYETIQPVVQKETIQPSVVHTTVPIHEVHHNEARHHATSALPAVSMHEFRQQGGSLHGREARLDGFEGEPKPVGSTLGGATAGTTGLTGRTANNGPHDSNLANKADPRVDSDRDGRTALGHSNGNGYGNNTSGPHDSNIANKADPRVDSDRDGRSGMGSNTANTGPHNSKLLNKMDPRVDSDRDGKVGMGE